MKIMVIKSFFLILLISITLSSLFLIIGAMLKKKSNFDRELQSTFECGFSSLDESRLTFRVHFFLVAVVFVIFDVELIIIFPLFSTKTIALISEDIIIFSIFVTILLMALFNE